MRSTATRRLIALCLTFAFSVAVVGCGGGSDRERNAQTIAGQPCRTLGQTKTVSKVVNVCGRSGADLVWYAAVSRKPTGGKCTRPGGYRLANAKALVCAVIDKKRMWIEVAPLPFMPTTSSTVAGETTAPSNVGAQGIAGTTVPPAATAPSSAEGAANTEAAAAFAELAPRNAVPRDDVPSKSVTVEEVVAFAKTNLPPVRLVLTSKPATSRNGGKVSPAPSFQMVDEVGGARPAAGIEVQASSATVGAVVSGGVGVTDASGAVSFPNLVVSGPPGRVDIAVLAAGYEGSAFSVTHAVGDAVGALLLDSVESVKAGEKWMNSPRLQLVDVTGWEVRTSGVEFTMTATDVKGKTVELGTASTNDEGIVEFETFTLTKVGTWKIKVAAEAPAIQPVEYDVEVYPSDADGLSVVSAAPDALINGAASPTAVKVQLVDEFGNSVARSGVKVQADVRKIDDQPVAVTGASATTDAKGIATFDELKVTGLAGMIAVNFSSPDNAGFKGSPGFATMLVAGAPKALVVGIEPWLARSGLALGRAPSVHLVDESGNKVVLVGENVQVVATGANGSIAVANGSAKFDDEGVATFAGLSLSGKVGVVTLTFAYGAITTTFDIALVSGPLAKLRVKEHPRSLVAGETFSGVIELLDADDNLFPFPGATVLAKVDGKQIRGAISGTTGDVTLDQMTINSSGRFMMTYEVFNSSNGTLLVASEEVRVAPASPYAVEVVAAKDLWVANDREFGDANGAIKIQVRDRLGNAVLAGQTARAFVVRSPGDHVLTGDTAVTDDSGVATFSKLKIVGSAGVYSLGFQVPGYNSVTYAAKVNLTGGMPVTMRVKRPLAGLANGAIASVQPIIELVDSGGNVSPAMNVVVEAWITAGNAPAYLAGEARSTNEGTVTFASIRGRGKPGAATVTYKTTMIKPRTETSVSQDVVLAAGAAVSYNASTLGKSIASGTGVGRITAFDADGYPTAITASSVMIELRGSVPTTQPKVWVKGTAQFVEGGVFDASDTRLYGLKNESATLAIHIGGVKVFEHSLTFSSDPAIGDPGVSTGSVVAAVLAKPVPAVTGITPGGRVIEIVDPDFVSTSPEYFSGAALVENVVSRTAITAGKTAVGLGASNTGLMVASHAKRNTFGIAKSVADAVIGGFGDWFLGSIDEYVLIERNLRTAKVPYPFTTLRPTASSSDFNDGQIWALDPTTKAATKFSWSIKFVDGYPLRFIG